MKKSKIIVPALALLLLSTAATVSGSVAWFTANRTFETSINDFEVVNTEGNLDVEMTAGLGTTVTNNVAAINNGVKLGDASFNHTDGHLFTDTITANTYKDLGTYTDAITTNANWRVGSAGTTYYAVSWKMTFKYTFAADQSTQNLYLDPTSTMTKSDVATKAAQNESTADASIGFRIAFVGETATYTTKKVWSDLETDENMQSYDYVASTSTKGNYNGDIISTADAGGTSGLVANTAETGANTAANYLGNFNYSQINGQSVASITFGCVAWFEGCDTTNVINDAAFYKIASTMKFFVAKAA